MTKEEALYQQETFILAYLYAHPEEFDNAGLNKTHFKNIDTAMMFELMSANYRYNERVLVNAHQVISGMAKNKRFNALLDNVELIDIVFCRSDDYLVTKAIFDGYVRYSKKLK